MFEQSAPGVEDTASIISRYTFSYIQNVLFLAYKAQKISVEELPQISDKRTADYLSSKVFNVGFLTFSHPVTVNLTRR